MRKDFYEFLADLIAGCILLAGATGSLTLLVKSAQWLIETVGGIW